MRILHFISGLGVLAMAVLAGCGMVKSMGQNPEGDDLAYLQTLSNYKDGWFQNEVARPVLAAADRVTPLKALATRRESITPSYKLPWVRIDLKKLPAPAPTLVWFGHSSLLIKTGKANILIDPVFSDHAGPVPGLVSAFKGTTHYHAKDMPPIDILILSHDHYDHMDYHTLMQLKGHVKHFVVPVGVGSHLRYWGFDKKKITELNWADSVALPGDVNITATPAQHRSNRSYKEESKTLWASFVIKMGDYKIYYGGDSGYGPHFKEIGQKYGPFNLALLECGQFSPNWPWTHLQFGETAQAAADLHAAMIQPIHWAKFIEANHPWNEPIKMLMPTAKKMGIPVNAPRIGEPYTLGDKPKTMAWWDFE